MPPTEADDVGDELDDRPGGSLRLSLGGVSARVELQRNGQDVVVPARWEWTAEITTDPSPTAEATRLTDPARTSPAANTPGTDVAKPSRVTTNPLASSSTPTSCSQAVLGSAPIIRKRPAASSRTSRSRTWSRQFSALSRLVPWTADSSERGWTVTRSW